jgi:hypothetical protein
MQNIQLMPQRPPYVEFEQRAEEDRAETVKQGHYVARDVDYAIIRAIGAKDAVEKPAVEWLGHLDQLVTRQDYPREWAKFFREQYNDWKAGNEPSVNGTHVRQWSAISRAQAEMLVAAKILTVEDLAVANEETLQRIGMGSRGLKQRAQAWLDTAAKNGSAEELAMLREKTANQDAQIAELNRQVAALISKVEADGAGKTEPRKRSA